MSEPPETGISTILQPYVTYFNARFQRPNGSTYSVRGRQVITRKYRMPVAKIGQNEFIDPVAGDQRILEFAQHQNGPEALPPRPRRGRPPGSKNGRRG